jgi:hypothetical protein
MPGGGTRRAVVVLRFAAAVEWARFVLAQLPPSERADSMGARVAGLAREYLQMDQRGDGSLSRILEQGIRARVEEVSGFLDSMNLTIDEAIAAVRDQLSPVEIAELGDARRALSSLRTRGEIISYDDFNGFVLDMRDSIELALTFLPKDQQGLSALSSKLAEIDERVRRIGPVVVANASDRGILPETDLDYFPKPFWWRHELLSRQKVDQH